MIEQGRAPSMDEPHAHAPPGPIGAPAWSRGDEPEDAAVVAEVLAGDVEAFAIIVRRYRDSYARFAAGMLDDVDAAEDALHAAFVRAFRTLDRCADPSRFGAWLYRLAASECLARSPKPVPARERVSTIAALPVDERAALLLHRVEELTLDEMAELTGEAAPVLAARLERAERRLRPGAGADESSSSRAPVTLSASFGARVMDSVRVESRVQRRVAERRVTPPESRAAVTAPAPSWWRRRFTVTVTPAKVMGAVALVALIAAVAAWLG